MEQGPCFEVFNPDAFLTGHQHDILCIKDGALVTMVCRAVVQTESWCGVVLSLLRHMKRTLCRIGLSTPDGNAASALVLTAHARTLYMYFSVVSHPCRYDWTHIALEGDLPISVQVVSQK
jgi:hypothetical protein